MGDDIGLLQASKLAKPQPTQCNMNTPGVCTADDSCQGGHGIQPCSSCQSWSCASHGTNGGSCSCNGDEKNNLWQGSTCSNWKTSNAQPPVSGECVSADVCSGGNGPQPCSTCQEVLCGQFGC